MLKRQPYIVVHYSEIDDKMYPDVRYYQKHLIRCQVFKVDLGKYCPSEYYPDTYQLKIDGIIYNPLRQPKKHDYIILNYEPI